MIQFPEARSPSPRGSPPGAAAFLTPHTPGPGRARSPHAHHHALHTHTHTHAHAHTQAQAGHSPLHAHAHKPRALDPADDTADLEELEHFAKTFKQRRIKLGNTYIFLYQKDKANERTDHLMVSDHRSPQPCNTRGTTDALPAFKVEKDSSSEGTCLVLTW